MKKINLFLVTLIFLSTIVKGQDYIPLIDTLKQWNILQYEFDNEPNYDDLLYINTIGERFRGDTIINGLHYTYLEICKNDSSFNSWTRGDYLFREDTVNGRVYVNNYEQEVLIYDFSLNVGDTLKIYNDYVVDSIKTEFIANKNRKVLYLGNTCEGFSIIEGIGTYFDILEPIYWCNVGSTIYNELLCFSLNNETLIQNGENCYRHEEFTSVSDNLNSNFISVYPNPVSDILIIESNSIFKNLKILIYKIDGSLVISDEISSCSNEIPIYRLNDGLYILKIKNHERLIYCEKIVVKKD